LKHTLGGIRVGAVLAAADVLNNTVPEAALLSYITSVESAAAGYSSTPQRHPAPGTTYRSSVFKPDE